VTDLAIEDHGDDGANLIRSTLYVLTMNSAGTQFILSNLGSFQSKNATELDLLSVFISTRCQPSSRIVAWSGWVILPRT
jgi:hypothetical protein